MLAPTLPLLLLQDGTKQKCPQSRHGNLCSSPSRSSDNIWRDREGKTHDSGVVLPQTRGSGPSTYFWTFGYFILARLLVPIVCVFLRIGGQAVSTQSSSLTKLGGSTRAHSWVWEISRLMTFRRVSRLSESKYLAHWCMVIWRLRWVLTSITSTFLVGPGQCHVVMITTLATTRETGAYKIKIRAW